MKAAQRKLLTIPWSTVALALLVAGCGARVKEDTIGGESHFLSACDSQQSAPIECGGDLSCLGGLCTRACTEPEDCVDLALDALCVTDSEGRQACGVPEIQSCEYEGTTYQRGDRWECDCNTCMCTASGIASTKKGCVAYTCVANDETYELGDVVVLASGVSCVCLEGGEIGRCTGAIEGDAATTDMEDSAGDPDQAPTDASGVGSSASECAQACAEAVALECDSTEFCIAMCEDLPSLFGGTATDCIAAAEVYDDCVESGSKSPLACIRVENGREYAVAERCESEFFDVLACQTNCADKNGNPCP